MQKTRDEEKKKVAPENQYSEEVIKTNRATKPNMRS